jgi:hypothetical protein
MTFGDTTFVPPCEELPTPGEDEVPPKIALDLGPSFLFFVTLPPFPVIFLSETILTRSAAKSAILSEKQNKELNSEIEI